MSSATMRQRFGGTSAGTSASEDAAPASSLTSLDSTLKTFVSKYAPEGTEYEDIKWFNIFFLIFVHIGALYGLALTFTSAGGSTLAFWALGVMWPITGMGITVGVHRLWSHKAYKAKFVTRVGLAILNSAAYQGSIFDWARDHRVHHMKSETNGDPYNFHRGWFFAHMGWIMVRKHPDVIAAGRKVNVSDLEADPVVVWQHKLYLPSVFLFCYILPTLFGYAMTGDAWSSFWILGVFRHVFVLQTTWCVNSLAHALSHGYRPYSMIHPTESWVVSLISVGEGWHNFHHAIPYDYRAAEGHWWQYNPSKTVIDILYFFGLVSDLRTGSPALIAKQKERMAERVAAGVSVLQVLEADLQHTEVEAAH